VAGTWRRTKVAAAPRGIRLRRRNVYCSSPTCALGSQPSSSCRRVPVICDCIHLFSFHSPLLFFPGHCTRIGPCCLSRSKCFIWYLAVGTWNCSNASQTPSLPLDGHCTVHAVTCDCHLCWRLLASLFYPALHLNWTVLPQALDRRSKCLVTSESDRR
jgi:hypothetical protein